MNRNSVQLFSVIVALILTLIFVSSFSIAVVLIKFPEPVVYSEVRISLEDYFPPEEEIPEIEELIEPEEMLQDSEEQEMPMDEASEQIEENADSAEPEIAEAPVSQPEEPVVQEAPKPAPVPAKTAETPKNQTQQTAPAQKQTSTPAAQPSRTQTPAPKVQETPVAPSSQPTKTAQTTQTPAETPKVNPKTEADKNAIWDSMFGDDDPAPAQTQPIAAKVTSNTYGSSGSDTQSQSSSQGAVSSSSGRSTGQSTSSNTTDMLSKMQKRTYSSSSTKVSSQAKVDAAVENGKVFFKLENNTFRELLSPSSPAISISDEAAAGTSFGSTTTISISFTIQGDGTVLYGNIIVPNEANLGTKMVSEIKSQISSWKFSADPNGASGKARFDYTIQVK